MPKFKLSPGKITIATPHESFGIFVNDLCSNLRDWNPQYVQRRGSSWVWIKNKEVLWKISILGTKILAETKEPVIYLGGHTRILMGSGRLEIA
jgi:hypothetical protein